MNLQYLYYFRELAECQHYSLAADSLFITQSGLSYAISELEKSLGVSLFEKHGRNIRLTNSGMVYYERITKILDDLEAASNAARRASIEMENQLSLAVTSNYLAGMYLYPFFETKEYASYRSISMDALSQFKALVFGDIQFGHCGIYNSDARYEKLVLPGLEYVVLVPEEHELAGQESVNIREISRKYPFILHSDSNKNIAPIKQLLQSEKVYFEKVAFECSSTGSAAWAVSQGQGISLVAKIPMIDEFRVKALPVSDINMHINFYLYRFASRAMGKLESEFWEYCRQFEVE